MTDLRLVQPESLNAAQRAAFSDLLQSKTAARILQGRNPLGLSDGKLFLLGAYNEEELIGCLAFATYDVINVSDLFYIAVKSEFQGQSIAFQLLKRLNEELKRFNIDVCWARYAEEETSTPIIKHLFAKCGWGDPFHETTRIYIDAPEFDPPWKYRNYKLPAGCEIFFWRDLTDNERNKLRYQESQLAFPSFISPFSTKFAIEPANSLGIKYKGEVVAWLITHRISKDTIRYSSLFVPRELRNKPIYMILALEAIRLQNKANIRWAYCEVNMSQGENTWKLFALNKLKLYSKRVENLMVSTLDLSKI